MKKLNFYSKVKEIVIRSSEEGVSQARDQTYMMFNIRIFHAMLKELRIRLDVVKAGLGPEKFMRIIN